MCLQILTIRQIYYQTNLIQALDNHLRVLSVPPPPNCSQTPQHRERTLHSSETPLLPLEGGMGILETLRDHFMMVSRAHYMKLANCLARSVSDICQ